MIFLFWMSFFVLFISWFLYPGCVIIFSKKPSSSRQHIGSNSFKPSITIIIAAFNEETKIRSRIDDIFKLDGDYVIDVLVASDGSEDRTVEIVNAIGKKNVRAIDFQPNRGRASVHNDSAFLAKGEIIVFTDAESRFDSQFLRKIIPHFIDPSVGIVSGRISYLNENASCIGEAAGLYWRYEEATRTAENNLGILAFGTGAALAIRRQIYTPISPKEDIDYAETLEVKKLGYMVSYESSAFCFDHISETAIGAFKTRIRQTSRAFKSIARRVFTPLFILQHPGVFFSILLHKTVRQITPFLMLTLFFCNIYLLGKSTFYTVLCICQLLFYTTALIGFFSFIQMKLPIPLLLPYNFVLLNAGRGIGILYALIGKERATYRTQR